MRGGLDGVGGGGVGCGEIEMKDGAVGGGLEAGQCGVGWSGSAV